MFNCTFDLFNILLFSESCHCIIIAGGRQWNDALVSGVEVVYGNLKTKQLPNIAKGIYGSSLVLHNGAILLSGGKDNFQKCLQLDHGNWKEHTTLLKERILHSVVATETATFIFGGSPSCETYEYLPNGSIKWVLGTTEIPGGFWSGCAIEVKSKRQVWLIGGYGFRKRILCFNVKDHRFEIMPSLLNVERFAHRCAYIPNTSKVMITGGTHYDGCLASTEILDTKDGSITMASPMNSKRSKHGMGVLTINGEERLAVFGGYDGRKYLDSVEIYNRRTEKWETTEIKLNKLKSDFGFLSVNLGQVL